MAIVNKNFIHPSGTAGEYVFRKRNGKTVMYSRPVNQKVSQSHEAKQARSVFALNTKFAVLVNSFPYLKLAWKNAKVKGSNNFQKVIKSNIHLTKKYGISAYNIITPPGIYAGSYSVTLNETRIQVALKASEEFNSIMEPSFIMHIIFCFCNPQQKRAEPFTLFGMTNEVSFTQGNENYNITLTLEERIKAAAKKYTKAVIFIAACSTETGRKIFWSSTVSDEISI